MKRGVAFTAGCAVLAAMLVALPGCAVKRVSAATQESLAVAVNDFGLDLLRETATDPGKNAIVSPVSVHAALSMTANGARSGTAEQMRGVLQLEAMSAQDSNEGWAFLLYQLDRRSARQTLEIANALWADEGVEFKEPFLDANRDYFDAEVSALDFGDPEAVREINRWASKNTRGMIPKVIDRIPPGTILYLTNAVYFKGKWDSAFEKDATREMPFTKAGGSKVRVDMMHANEEMPYFENKTLQATRLGYKGGDTAFYVLLPKKGVKPDAVLESLGRGGFAELRREIDAAEETDVILELPKVDLECSTSLKESLSRMGMSRAFDQYSSELSGIAESPNRIYIDEVLHTTKVKVDEEGTEAAAVTVVGVAALAAVPETKFKSIICDRPYLFAIVDEGSGTMLFLGVVNDPRG